MEYPSCQKTLLLQGFISQKPPACAAFYDVLPWMSTVVLIPQHHGAIFSKYHSANAVFHPEIQFLASSNNAVKARVVMCFQAMQKRFIFSV